MNKIKELRCEPQISSNVLLGYPVRQLGIPLSEADIALFAVHMQHVQVLKMLVNERLLITQPEKPFQRQRFFHKRFQCLVIDLHYLAIFQRYYITIGRRQPGAAVQVRYPPVFYREIKIMLQPFFIYKIGPQAPLIDIINIRTYIPLPQDKFLSLYFLCREKM